MYIFSIDSPEGDARPLSGLIPILSLIISSAVFINTIFDIDDK